MYSAIYGFTLQLVQINRSSLEAEMVVQNGHRMVTMYLSGIVGLRSGISAGRFVESLTNLGKYDVLYAMLDSSGSSPIDAWTIFDFLTTGPPRRCRPLVLITGDCSGDAVLIALAFDQTPGWDFVQVSSGIRQPFVWRPQP